MVFFHIVTAFKNGLMVIKALQRLKLLLEYANICMPIVKRKLLNQSKNVHSIRLNLKNIRNRGDLRKGMESSIIAVFSCVSFLISVLKMKPLNDSR